MGQGEGMEFLKRLNSEILIFDGGMGTMLFAAGLLDGACPELWNDTHPGIVRGIHKGYFDAGSDLVETNTFGGTRLKFGHYGIPERTRELNVTGAQLARSVCPPGRYVAGSIGPTSQIPQPYGDVSEDELYANFKEQAEALAEGGVDLFAVETMMFPDEAKMAIRACKDATGFPVMATMFFQYEEAHDRDRTMWGDSPADVAVQLLEFGADVVGMNCGRGPDRAAAILREMRAVTDAPLIAYPNAGMPIVRDGRTTYELGPDEMAAGYPPILDVGGRLIVGACCGSTPTHISRIAEVMRARRPGRLVR